MTRQILKDHLGLFLTWSRTDTDWSAEMIADAERIIRNGENAFYVPSYKKNPQAPTQSHVWSFLSTTLTLSLVNGTNAYDCPDDFSGFVDTELAYTTSNDWPLKLVEMWRVLEKIQAGTSMPSGITKPLLAAVRPKSVTATTGQIQQVLIWPTPTGSLTATGRYRTNPSAMSDDSHYPLGGAQFAECLLESVLASAEQFIDSPSTQHRERFAELLPACIDLDRRIHMSEAA